jgi:hypothetical protein
MAEVILRGKVGTPSVRREGTAIVVKKTIAGATIEERTAATRVNGKQSATGNFSSSDIKASLKSSNNMANIIVAKVSTAAALAAKEVAVKMQKT